MRKSLTSLPRVLQKEVTSFLLDPTELKLSSKVFHTIDDEKMFDNNLPYLLLMPKTLIKLTFLTTSLEKYPFDFLVCKNYILIMVAFWKCGMYLNLLPKFLSDLIVYKFATDDHYYFVSEIVHPLLVKINYDNWYTTNKKGVLRFIRQLNDTIGWNLANELLTKQIGQKRTTIADIKSYVDDTIDLVISGEFTIDEYFNYLKFMHRDSDELRTYITFKMIHPSKVESNETKDELKEIKDEPDKICQENLEFIYQSLLEQSLKNKDYFLASQIIKYKFKKYNLEITPTILNNKVILSKIRNLNYQIKNEALLTKLIIICLRFNDVSLFVSFFDFIPDDLKLKYYQQAIDYVNSDRKLLSFWGNNFPDIFWNIPSTKKRKVISKKVH